MIRQRFIFIIFSLVFFMSCTPKSVVDITPYKVNPEADIYYKQALTLLASYDVDSTKKSLRLLDKAFAIDSMNPDYYGVKAKILIEMGYLDSALSVQKQADKKGAITGEYLFQLGLLQSAKEQEKEAHKSFERSNNFLQAVLKKYPDSLGAFILQQATNALYMKQDSLFMKDIQTIRKQFPERLMEIEMTRRLKPTTLIEQIRKIEREAMIEDISIQLDSMKSSLK